MNLTWFLFVAVSAVFAWGVWTFNRLVNQRNMLREAWSGIAVQLKRRHDLVPAMVACVEGYRGHERKLFEDTQRQQRVSRFRIFRTVRLAGFRVFALHTPPASV
jgi:hypothetical protein